MSPILQRFDADASPDAGEVRDLGCYDTQLVRGFAVAVAVATAFGSILGACGSGGSGTAAEQAKQAVSSKTGSTPTTAGDPGTATTVTEPPRTVTKTETTTETKTQTGPTQTKTESVTTPGQTTESNKVIVAPASTTGKGESEGVPGWGWVLIALGAISIGACIYWVGHRHGSRQRSRAGTPGAVGDPSGPGAPRRPAE